MKRYMMNVTNNAVMDLNENVLVSSPVFIEISAQEKEEVLLHGKTWRDICNARDTARRPPEWYGKVTSENVTSADCAQIADSDLVAFYHAALNLAPDDPAAGEAPAVYYARVRADLLKKVGKLEAARARAASLKEKAAEERRRKREIALAANDAQRDFKTLL